MKKICLLSICCILLSASAFAQSSIRTWKMGPLTWNDFHHNTKINNQTSYLEYFFNIKSRDVKVNNVSYTLPEVVAYTDPGYSWADTNYRTPQLLAYNQCLFDLIEVHRRKIELEIITSNLFDTDELMKKGIHRMDEDLMRAETEMAHGQDSLAISQWQAKVKQDLNNLTPFTPTRFEDGNFGLGASLGLGLKATTGSLSKYFTSGGGFVFNFDIMSKRHYFTWGTYIGAAGCRQNIWEKDFFDELGVVPPAEGRFYYSNGAYEEPLIYKGETATVLDMYWAYGFSVLNNNVHKFTPFVGIGMEGYYVMPDDISYGPTAFSWHFGLDYNWQYSNHIDHGSFSFDNQYNCTHDVLSLNCKLYATYNNFRNTVGTPQGFSINLQINFALMGGNAHYE